jgi:hypothetical protein
MRNLYYISIRMPVARQPARSVKKAARQTARARAAITRAGEATVRRTMTRKNLLDKAKFAAPLIGPVAPIGAAIGYGIYEAGEGAYRGATTVRNAFGRFRDASPLRHATRRIFGRATTGYRANKPGNVIDAGKPIMKDLHVKLKILPDLSRPLAEGPQVKVVPYVAFGGVRGNSNEIVGEDFEDLAEKVKDGFESLKYGDKFARHAIKMADVSSDRYKRWKKSMIQKVVEAIKRYAKNVTKHGVPGHYIVRSEYTGRFSLTRTYLDVSPLDVAYFITPHYAGDDVQPRLQFLFESGYPWNLEVPDNTPEVVLDFIIRADELRTQVASESDYDAAGTVLPRATYAAGAALPGSPPGSPPRLGPGPGLGLLPKPLGPKPGAAAATAARLTAGAAALPAGSLAGALAARPGFLPGSGRVVPPRGSRVVPRGPPPPSGRGPSTTLLGAPGAPPAPPAPPGRSAAEIAAASHALAAARGGPTGPLLPPPFSAAGLAAGIAGLRKAGAAPKAGAPPPLPQGLQAGLAARAAALAGKPVAAAPGLSVVAESPGSGRSSATFGSSPGGIGQVRTPVPGGGARTRRNRRGRKDSSRRRR